MRHGKTETEIVVLSFLLLPLFLFSCAGERTLRPLSSADVSIENLIERITYDDLQTLRGTSSMKIYQDDEYTAYFTGAMNYLKPNRLAMSVFGPFGVTIMKLLIADGTIEIYVPNKDTLYTADLSVPFLLPDSVSLRSFRTEISETDDDIVLNIFASGNYGAFPNTRYFFSKKDLFNHRIEKYKGNNLIFAIDIDALNEHNIPSEFSIIAGESRFVIAANDLTVNAEIPERVFSHMSASQRLPIQDFLRTLDPNR